MSDLWAKFTPPESLIIFFMSKWPQKIVQVGSKFSQGGSECSHLRRRLYSSWADYERIMSGLWAGGDTHKKSARIHLESPPLSPHPIPTATPPTSQNKRRNNSTGEETKNGEEREVRRREKRMEKNGRRQLARIYWNTYERYMSGLCANDEQAAHATHKQ